MPGVTGITQIVPFCSKPTGARYPLPPKPSQVYSLSAASTLHPPTSQPLPAPINPSPVPPHLPYAQISPLTSSETSPGDAQGQTILSENILISLICLALFQMMFHFQYPYTTRPLFTRLSLRPQTKYLMMSSHANTFLL